MDMEGAFLALQPAMERTALDLAKSDPKLMISYLTNYCVTQAEMVVTRWRELGECLLTKYNDGYVKDENGRPQEKGYPETCLREVSRSRPHLRLPQKREDVPESKLVD